MIDEVGPCPLDGVPAFFVVLIVVKMKGLKFSVGFKFAFRSRLRIQQGGQRFLNLL